ncbi:thioredoxin family protein [Rhodanobacter sp. L36]|uniref:thioredoxin family protein n=1 Tax=Rhodanobacter sp. L36 TaxID=1747221 RepID=UPI00131CB2C3|nr:thioredoxin family protein [Rhodanobacter sp. L36]
MADTSAPTFFEQFPMRRVRSDALEDVLRDSSEPLSILFLWGRDCPNCDVAKRAMLLASERFQWPQVRWLHDNVYDDPDMATRFGLHGIPAFFVFHGARKLGRITAWPGADAFAAAIEKQVTFLSASLSIT